MRKRKRDNLARIGRVRHNFLVASQRGIKAHLTHGTTFGADALVLNSSNVENNVQINQDQQLAQNAVIDDNEVNRQVTFGNDDKRTTTGLI